MKKLFLLAAFFPKIFTMADKNHVQLSDLKNQVEAVQTKYNEITQSPQYSTWQYSNKSKMCGGFLMLGASSIAGWYLLYRTSLVSRLMNPLQLGHYVQQSTLDTGVSVTKALATTLFAGLGSWFGIPKMQEGFYNLNYHMKQTKYYLDLAEKAPADELSKVGNLHTRSCEHEMSEVKALLKM